jgi:glucose/arabinose dehydrogenase
MSRLDDVAVILHQEGPLSSGNHFGCRIVQTPDNNLFLTLGEHFTTRNQAQNLANHLGKIVRIRPDGSVPADNPFVGKQGAKPEIWSFGHRIRQAWRPLLTRHRLPQLVRGYRRVKVCHHLG